MKNYLVTGGCGFIGSHLSDRLIEQGDRVYILDDLSTGDLNNLNPSAEFFELDVSNKDDVRNLFLKHQFDGVFHQASHINTSVPGENPHVDIAVNVTGTLNLIEGVLSQGICKFVYASSVAVYGTPNLIPVSEKVAVDPNFSYGIAKYTGEEYVRYYAANRGLTYGILRYSNIYGPRQPIFGEVGVIAIFTRLLSRQKPITVFGSGEHVRDFLYVGDAIDATVSVMSDQNSGAYNVSSGIGTSVAELVEMFQESVDFKISVERKPERSNEIGQFFAANDLLRQTISWSPSIDLETGIRRTLDYEIGLHKAEA